MVQTRLVFAKTVTYGHIYAAGARENYNYDCSNWHCARYPGRAPPSFFRKHYYCESGNTALGVASAEYYTEDPLWDGAGLVNNNRCTDANQPRFFCQLVTNRQDDIEARL